MITHMISFFIMSISVYFLKKSTKILVPMLTIVHDRRTSNKILLHPYLCDARSSSFTAFKQDLFYFTGDLASFWTTSRSLPSAVTHLQSLTTGLCLDDAEETSRKLTPKHRRYLQSC
ncbi:uncharacterized protein LOC124311943 [Daphnia pulicaria]|uniref:uncharacterized protein LOC124311943 n=1 Tax=Daphnia pulicaria TaxID=35523 RepID=UPI001EEC95C1|nr:uncharacterized protein LOC124311943 [Daphnia pulicaria]